MDTITVVARETFPYADVIRRAGDVFEATTDDARILQLIGKVTLPEDAPAAVTKDQAAESGEIEPVAKKRTYRRRDLVAEP